MPYQEIELVKGIINVLLMIINLNSSKKKRGFRKASFFIN